MRATQGSRIPALRAPSTAPGEAVLAATSDPRALVRYMHSEVKLSDRELEKVIGAHRVTISRWRSNTSEPRGTGRLDDLRVIVALLVNSGVFDAEEVGRFLRSRDDSLGQRPPLAFLGHTEDEDKREEEFRRVLEVTQRLVDRVLVTDNSMATADQVQDWAEASR